MDRPYPPAALEALGKALVLRRRMLGYPRGQRGAFASYRGWPLADKTLARLERGDVHDYSDSTIEAVERLYDLQPGAVERFLDAVTRGETAVLDVAQPEVPLDGDGGGSPDSTGDELLDRIMRLPELSMEERRMFVALAESMRARRELDELRARQARDTRGRGRNGSEAAVS